MSRPRTLGARFNVFPDETRVVYVLLLHSFCAGVSQTLTQTAGFSLFLSAYSVRLLPFLYFGVTVAAVTVTIAMLRLQQRISFAALMLGGVGLIVVVLFGFRVALQLGDARAVAIALPIWYRVMYAFLNVEFWGVAGRLFNVRQGKRLFGLISSGKVAGSALSGLATPALVAAWGTSNLLVVAVLGMLGLFGSLVYLIRAYGARLATAPETEAARNGTSTGRWWRTRYIELVFALSALSVVGYLVVDNIFLDLAHGQFPDTAQLASFLGVYEGILGCVTLIGTLFISGPFLARFGVGAGLLAQPAAVAVSALLALTMYAATGSATLVFVLVTIMRVLNISVSDTLSQPTIGLLYQPLPAALRLRVQTAATGIIPALAACSAAGVLLIFNTLLGFSAIQLIFVLLFFLALWIGVAVLLQREYAPMLLQALSGRRLYNPALSLNDGSSIPILRRALAQPEPAAAIYALRMLVTSGTAPFTDMLADLLAHPSPAVRVEVLHVIEQQRPGELVPAILQRLEREDDGRVRGALLRTLAVLDADAGREQALPFLRHADAETRLGALVGLLRSGGVQGVLLAGTQLLDLARSSSAADRALAARVLGGVGNAAFYEPLAPLLRDEAPEVRKAAVAAAGVIKAPRLWSLVVENLDVAGVRGAAAAALVAGGAEVVPELRAVFDGNRWSQRVVCRVARVGGRVRQPEAVGLLEEQIAYRDPVVRESVLTALSHSRYRAEGVAAERVWDRIRVEIANAARLMVATVAVGDGAELALVARALNERFERCRARLFLLLSFVREPQAILRARETLRRGPADRHAYALEILDIVIAHPLKPALLAVFDQSAPPDRLRRLGAFISTASDDRDEWLRAFAAGEDEEAGPWLRAVALHTLVARGSPPAREAVVVALSDSDAVVRETAARAVNWRDGAASSRVHGREQTGMLSTIEKVLMLKTVSIFADTPDEILADLAPELEETVAPAGTTIFTKGDPGDSLYIIAYGRVRVHDGTYTLNELGERAVFGEMAALDAAPRSASVTTVEDTTLFRLRRDALYEVMADRIEVVHGIIHVLSEYVRARAKDVTNLSARVEALEGTPQSRSSLPRA